MPSGPVVAAPQVQVAEADDSEDVRRCGAARVAGSHDSGALEDTCIAAPPTAASTGRWMRSPRAVADERAGKLGRPVRVSWYGDSVVATDAIPGRLRARMQTELGDGGPGFVYVVPPHRFCEHGGDHATSSGKWPTHSISTMQTADGLYGVGGSTTETEGGKATIQLVAGKITSAELYYLAQPGGGTRS